MKNKSLVLYKSKKTDYTAICIEAKFKRNGNLEIKGNDSGSFVEELWGSDEYNYSISVKRKDLGKLYTALHLNLNDEKQLLNKLLEEYNTDKCFSEIKNLLIQLEIKHNNF